jgi:hypothetical protein
VLRSGVGWESRIYLRLAGQRGATKNQGRPGEAAIMGAATTTTSTSTSTGARRGREALSCERSAERSTLSRRAAGAGVGDGGRRGVEDGRWEKRDLPT